MPHTRHDSRPWLTVALWVAFGGGFVALIWLTATGNEYAIIIIGGFWALIGIGYAVRLISNRGRISRTDPLITAAENLQTLHTGTTPDHTHYDPPSPTGKNSTR